MLTFAVQLFFFCEKYEKHSFVWHQGSDFPADAWEARGTLPLPGGYVGSASRTSRHYSMPGQSNWAIKQAVLRQRQDALK